MAETSYKDLLVYFDGDFVPWAEALVGDVLMPTPLAVSEEAHLLAKGTRDEVGPNARRYCPIPDFTRCSATAVNPVARVPRGLIR